MFCQNRVLGKLSFSVPKHFKTFKNQVLMVKLVLFSPKLSFGGVVHSKPGRAIRGTTQPLSPPGSDGAVTATDDAEKPWETRRKPTAPPLESRRREPRLAPAPCQHHWPAALRRSRCASAPCSSRSHAGRSPRGVYLYIRIRFLSLSSSSLLSRSTFQCVIPPSLSRCLHTAGSTLVSPSPSCLPMHFSVFFFRIVRFSFSEYGDC